MLVLSRKQHEQIIAGDIVITVLAVKGNRVQIGVSAPPQVPIRRAEIPPRTQSENNEHAHTEHA